MFDVGLFESNMFDPRFNRFAQQVAQPIVSRRPIRLFYQSSSSLENGLVKQVS